MIHLDFKDHFILTVGYSSLHTLIVRYLNLKDKDLTTHKILLTFLTLLVISSEVFQLGWTDRLWDISTGAILPFLTLAWFTVFAFLQKHISIGNLSSQVQLNIKIRILAIIHGSVLTWGSFYIMIDQAIKQNYSMQKISEQNSYLAKLIYMFTMSYFIYHTTLCFLYEYKGKGVFQHHILSIVCLIYFIYTDGYYYYSLIGFFLGQITNAIMHLKAIINKMGFVHTKISVLIEKIYLYSYIIIRTVIYIFLGVLPSILDTEVPFPIKFTMCSFLLFNIYIIAEMVQIIKKRAAKEKEMKQKGVQYQWFTVIDNKKLQKLSFYKEDTKDQ